MWPASLRRFPALSKAPLNSVIAANFSSGNGDEQCISLRFACSVRSICRNRRLFHAAVFEDLFGARLGSVFLTGTM